MGQINIAYEDHQVASLDRVAAARRVARPDLLRAIATEAIEAHDAGRLAFQRDAAPRLDVSISALVARLDKALMELERAQCDNLKREKKLLDAFVGSDANVRDAQAKLTTLISDINRKSYEPFVTRIREVCSLLEAAEDRLLAAFTQEAARLHQQLGVVAKVAAEPRVQYNLVLGDDRLLSLKFLGSAALLVGAAFILLFLLLVGQVQWLAVPVAQRLLADTEHVCQLVDRRYGVDNCQVPTAERKLAVAAIAAAK